MLPSGDYRAPEVCVQQNDSLSNTLPLCSDASVAVVEGCLGFAPVSQNLEESITRQGREIVRTLRARDTCSSTWQTRYRLNDKGALVSETLASSRCEAVPLRDSSSRTHERQDFENQNTPVLLIQSSANALSISQKAHARALLARALIEAQPSTCELFETNTLAPFLKRDALRFKLPRCAQDFLERELTQSNAALAEKALLRMLELAPQERALVVSRAVKVNLAPLALARSLRDAKDEHARLKEALFEGPANTYFSRSALALELFSEEAAIHIADHLGEQSCENAESVLSSFSEVGEELRLSKNTNRIFTPLLRAEKQKQNEACVRLRIVTASLLAERLAEGRQSTPAAWRLLLRTLERDPNVQVRVSLEREVRKRFSCKARGSNLMLPGFVLERFQEKGIEFLCAENAVPEEAKLERGLPDDPFLPSANVEDGPLSPPLSSPLAQTQTPSTPAARHDDFRFGALTGAEVFEEGGLLTLGIESLFPLDQTFSVVGGATLSLMCSECLSESVISRRDLRLEVGVRYMPVVLPITPYLRVSGLFANAETSTQNVAASAIMIGVAGAIGGEWLVADRYFLFIEAQLFALNEIEQVFPRGVPEGSPVPPLGRDPAAFGLRVGMTFAP